MRSRALPCLETQSQEHQTRAWCFALVVVAVVGNYDDLVADAEA